MARTKRARDPYLIDDGNFAQTFETNQDVSDDETQPPDTVESDIEAQEENLDDNVEQVYEDIEIRGTSNVCMFLHVCD